MRTHRLVPAACAVLALTACSHPGNAETDRQARTLATAISWPRQPDAAGFARAALATRLGRSAGFAVLVARDLPQANPSEPTAQLMIRIHLPALEPNGFLGRSRPAMDVCYELNFNYYGIIDEPDRTACPKDATPYTPPPLPVHWKIPHDAGDKLKTLLDALPPAPVPADVMAAVQRELGVPQANAAEQTPREQVLAQVAGADVGVSVRAGFGESMDCVLAARKGGNVRTFGLSWRETRPGEGVGCHPEVALRG